VGTLFSKKKYLPYSYQKINYFYLSCWWWGTCVEKNERENRRTMSKYFLEEGGGLSLGYLVVEKKFPIRYDIADANLGIGDSMASVVDPHPGIEPLDIDCQSMPTMLTDNGRWLPEAADVSRRIG
jgi:hypothetical protein